jgi:hypothetical protein
MAKRIMARAITAMEPRKQLLDTMRSVKTVNPDNQTSGMIN